MSEVDRAAEQTIISVLQKAYPNHGILAEESGLQPGQGDGADYLWIIDPLDGTTNFMHGLPHFAVSIACKYRGRLEHAVVARPGAPGRVHRQPRPWRRRSTAAASASATARAWKAPCWAPASRSAPSQVDNLDNYLGMFRSLVGQTAGIRRAGAASLDLAYVAAGRYDAFWEFGLSEWDMAAGALLIQEAGGLVSDFNGGHDFLEKGQIVAGNTKCFKAVLTAIQPHLAPSMKR